MAEGDWKPLSEYTKGDFVVVGIAALIAVAVVAFLVLAFIGVIPGATATDDPESTPTVIASPTPESTPEPMLLGGENRRACGLFWESYEWATERQEKGDTVFYFTNDVEVTAKFVTFRNGCRLEEFPIFLRNDAHDDFDVEQFRTEETELYHNGVRVDD